MPFRGRPAVSQIICRCCEEENAMSNAALFNVRNANYIPLFWNPFIMECSTIKILPKLLSF